MQRLATTVLPLRCRARHQDGYAFIGLHAGKALRLSVLLMVAVAAGCQTPVLETVLRFRPTGSPRGVDQTPSRSDQNQVSTDALLDRALHLKDEGRLNEARDTLTGLLRGSPDNFAAIDLLTDVSRDLDDRVLYRASLLRLIQLRPDSATVRHRAGVELLGLARIAAVRKSSLSGDNTNVKTSFIDTDEALVSSDVELGLRSLRRAVALEPHNRQFVQSLFGALVDLNRRTEAESVLSNALQRNPRDAVLPLTAARFYEAGNDWDTALSHYDRALQNDPANRVWMRQRAVCHFRMGNMEAAAVDFGRALTGTPVAPQQAEYLMWSEACLKNNDYAAALPVLDQIAMTGNLRTAETEMLRAMCRLRLGRHSDAGQVVADALVKWPRHAGLRRMAGKVEQAATEAATEATADAS